MHRGTPPISRTSSTAAPSLLAPSVFTPVPTNPAFSPIDLSNLKISPNSERAQEVDQFNQHVQEVFNPEPESPEVPGTPETEESIEPENLTEPEQVITDIMATITEKNNGKGEKCHAPKDFNGNKAKYKTWLRMTATYF